MAKYLQVKQNTEKQDPISEDRGYYVIYQQAEPLLDKHVLFMK
jgi:hypothetical protein